jgi:Fe-S oxidoreductase
MVYPEVGIATLELLERFGLQVDYPLNHTCCGQTMSNSGDEGGRRRGLRCRGRGRSGGEVARPAS